MCAASMGGEGLEQDAPQGHVVSSLWQPWGHIWGRAYVAAVTGCCVMALALLLSIGALVYVGFV